MKLKLIVNESTTDSELVHLGMFFTALGINRGAHVVSAPGDEAELDEPDEPEVPGPNADDAHIDFTKSATPVEAPKRRRRTKAEIEADVATGAAAAAPLKAALAAAEDAIEAEAKAEAGKDQPAPTPPAPETTTPAEEPASTQAATESPSDTKTYTPAEVQKIAVATAGRFGPEKVKAIIAQYPGAARIADLPLTELAGFVAKLNAVS